MSKLELLPDEALKEYLELIEARHTRDVREKARDTFMPFVHHVYENFIEGRHHRIIAEKLEKVARGEIKRLIVNMPPRHSKSEFASYLMPAWFLGRNPKLKIIQATHNTELAVRFGRKVRDLIDSDVYKEVFPNTVLKEDSKSAGRWSTDKGAEYFAAGVGAAMTGRGADLLIIDDPHSEQDALSETAFDNAYEWYTSGPRQRLQPGGAIILVMCMTGDTSVLMADGTEKNLRDIRRGDLVATYDKGCLESARINNWRSSGVDSVFKVRTQSGKVLRANERHPFLVSDGGTLKWIRLRDLRPGLELVSLRGATGPQEQKQNRGFAARARAQIATTGKIRTPPVCPLGTTESGSGLSAQTTTVLAQLLQKACAVLATRSSTPKEKLRSLPARTASSTAMGSLFRNTRRWFSKGLVDAMFAASLLLGKTPAHTGVGSFASTTATRQAGSGGFFATTVISLLGMAKAQGFCGQRRNTSSFTTDLILSIDPDGEEEVFDVEVDRTENFIANGVVSHNTRWSKKDLTGRLLAAQGNDILSDQWEVVEFPAILPSGNALWPEFWKTEELLRVKAALPLPKWSAQWQQQPTSSDSAIIRKEWWKNWEKEKIPDLKYVLQAYDTAFSKKETADYSAITTWGVFTPVEGEPDALILLDAKRGRWSFPELKEVAWEEHEYWEPDMVLIEAKASGQPLTDEFRARGIPAMTFSPGRRGKGGFDKNTRMHLVAPLFEAGRVWAPLEKTFAEEVVEEVTSFPSGDHDDFVDSMTLALMRFRQGGFVLLNGEEDGSEPLHRKKREYY